MGTQNTICNCKCQDLETNESILKSNHDRINTNPCVVLKNKNKPRESMDFITHKKIIDLELIKLNAAAEKITKLMRKYHDNYINDNDNKIDIVIVKNQVDIIEKKDIVKEENIILSKPVKPKIEFNDNNTKYIGTKTNDMKEGFGIQIGDDGRFVGYFKENKAEGFGFFIEDGDKYEGEFSQDEGHGFGVFTHLNGEKYTGYWSHDGQEPIGVEKWIDGSSYQGEYYQGKKQGIGVYSWPDCSRYEGEWNNNSINGYGIYHSANHTAYLGQWKNSIKEGFGEFIWEDKRYIGYYKNDKKDGFGIYYWTNSNKAIIGFWKNGKQEGFGIYMTSTKKKYGLWIAGILEKWFLNDKDMNNYLDALLSDYTKLLNISLDNINNYFKNYDILNDLLCSTE